MIPPELLSTVLISIIGVLFISFFYLSYKIVTRYNAIKKLDVIEFSTFMRTNSLDGSIQEVAGKVGEFLKGSLGCEKIIFLRKKRGALELNFYHGINRFDRNEFNINFSSELDSRLRTDFIPKSIDCIQDLIPDYFYERIKGYGINLYFPIFWRENLYGIYFIKSKLNMNNNAFNIITATLAQSLSTAYHIKWHESKQIELAERIEKIISRTDSENKLLKKSFSDMVTLVKKRNPDKLLNEIINILYNSMNLNEAALIYESKKDNVTKILIKGQDNKFLSLPSDLKTEDICRALYKRGTVRIDSIIDNSENRNKFITVLNTLGLKYLTHFPLTAGWDAFFAWSGEPFVNINRRIEFFKEHIHVLFENAETYEKIEGLSFTDDLTKLANQRYFQKRLHEEINRCNRFNRKLGLVFFDLDALKQTNDTYGHLAGDDILFQIGDILRNTIRTVDVVARYGGDEFCVIMPEADEETCKKFMERLKNEVTSANFFAEGVIGHIKCTISMGAAVYPNHADDAKKLIYVADMALLKAKECGRDQFIIYES